MNLLYPQTMLLLLPVKWKDIWASFKHSTVNSIVFFQAILKGERKFSKIVICGGKEDSEKLDYCAPCGVCRQVMMEFCDPETFEIILAKSINEYQKYLLKDLLPLGFGPNNLI